MTLASVCTNLCSIYMYMYVSVKCIKYAYYVQTCTSYVYTYVHVYLVVYLSYVQVVEKKFKIENWNISQIGFIFTYTQLL